MINNNSASLKERIKELESKIEAMNNELNKKKIGIAFVSKHLYINSIARYVTVLSDLLVKTGKYDVYLINEIVSDIDYQYNKKIKRIIKNIDIKNLKEIDEKNNIEIYILNNDISQIIDLYKSLGKKVVGIFHGVYLSSIYDNATLIYRSWKNFAKYDSFIHIIPDDYYVYKKFGFTNSIYIPNVNTFDYTKTPSSDLIYKNLLIVGRFEVEIKGGKYGLLAMKEILKKVPDAKLTMLGFNPPENLKKLAKKLKIENSVHWPGFNINITESYLNTSVLLLPGLSETYRMIINEAKAYGLPIVAFNIDYEPSLQSGVITVDMLDYKAMANEAIKLLSDYNYRKKKGDEAKLSLNNYLDNYRIVVIWDRLLKSLAINSDDYKILQEEVEETYYNEEEAKNNLEKHYHYAQQFNKYFGCHSFENMTNLSYINNIEVCPT